MSKLSEIKELKEEFANNLNQSDKFANTKGILQSFKSFCANHKLWIAGLSIPTALMINMSLSDSQPKQQKKSFDDMVVNSVQRLVDEEYDKMAKMSESEKIEYTAEKRAKLNPTRIVIHEINYDLADVNAVLAERAQGIKKEVKLGFTVIKNNKTQH